MYINKNVACDVKIAYIGGGSRGWAWGLMSDLVDNEDMSGSVSLYDIDYEASKANEIIGNKYNHVPGAKSHWDYKAYETIEEALDGADFVVISILPGTFDEMESDVHTPERYGIFQSVGDTTGPGGIVRTLRTFPMMEEIAEAIKKSCPNAWVINYTNPMATCVAALYSAFPEIKAFGCCHEVFGTQKLLKIALKEICDVEADDRSDIKVNVVGINHFTWITDAKYESIDLFPVYKKFCDKYSDAGYVELTDNNWMNNHFKSAERVKMDLFKKFGFIAAAGDRHLAEFCPGKWYMKNPEMVREWKFGLTSVQFRKENLVERLDKSKKLLNGKEEVKIEKTGEEGVNQMRALLGLIELVTNVNIPNVGQIPNLPMGAIVETNAVFRADSLTPVMAGSIPSEIYPLISRLCGEQVNLTHAAKTRDIKSALNVFANDPLVTCSYDEAKELFYKMIENTKDYLQMYDF